MPDKGASSMSLLHHELGVVVVDLSPQQLLHRPSHLLTSPHHPCDVVARMIPQTHAAVTTVSIWPGIGMLHNAIVSLQLFFQTIHLLNGQQIPAKLCTELYNQFDI